MTPTDSDALWLAVVGLAVLATYVYHLYRAFRLWVREGIDLQYQPLPLRAFRNLFIAAMLVVGMVRIDLGSWVRAYPDVAWLATLQNATAPLLTLMLLSGGLVLDATWVIDDRRAREHAR